MATYLTKYTNGQAPMPTPQGAELLNVRRTIPSEVCDNLVQNDIIELFKLPAGAVPHALEFAHDALDTDGVAKTLAVDVGILKSDGSISTDAADGGDEWLDGSDAFQSAAVTAISLTRLAAVQPVDVDRIIAIKVMTAAATPSNGGTIRALFTYRAAHHGE